MNLTFSTKGSSINLASSWHISSPKRKTHKVTAAGMLKPTLICDDSAMNLRLKDSNMVIYRSKHNETYMNLSWICHQLWQLYDEKKANGCSNKHNEPARICQESDMNTTSWIMPILTCSREPTRICHEWAILSRRKNTSKTHGYSSKQNDSQTKSAMHIIYMFAFER